MKRSFIGPFKPRHKKICLENIESIDPQPLLRGIEALLVLKNKYPVEQAWGLRSEDWASMDENDERYKLYRTFRDSYSMLLDTITEVKLFKLRNRCECSEDYDYSAILGGLTKTEKNLELYYSIYYLMAKEFEQQQQQVEQQQQDDEEDDGEEEDGDDEDEEEEEALPN